jgi:hypothetical protein
MRRGYWHQRVSTWVTASVLAGGLVSSIILFWLVRIENANIGITSVSVSVAK